MQSIIDGKKSGRKQNSAKQSQKGCLLVILSL